MKNVVFAAALLIGTLVHSQPVTEAPGPSSRKTPIAITEILYKPAPRADQRNTEFIELYNSNPWPEDISGFRLSGDLDFAFPPNTKINGLGYIVVAAAPSDVQAVYGLAAAFGPFTNSLKTSGTIRLLDEQGTQLLGIPYDSKMPWPMGADGTGHSIVLARPSYGEGDARAWERSELPGGSPGAAEILQPGPLRNVMINEVLAHTDPPQLDSIELYNHSMAVVDLSGCILTDDPSTNRFSIPAGTLIPPHGFVVFDENALGFALDTAGETIYFKHSDGSQVLDALRFEAQENGVSFGRYPDGAANWSRLTAMSFGTNNAPPRISPVGFNEIMYHPISGLDDDQFVELFNQGSVAIDLSGWKLDSGVSFKFPTNTILAAQSFLVVARNAERLRTNYAQLNATNLVGNFGGRLSASGERLVLTMPDTVASTNSHGLGVTNWIDIPVDDVTYGTGGRWGRWSDGGGSSLELIDARADKRLAANWADSDETAKGPWTTIETTGVLDSGSGNLSPLQLGLLDAGECLVDDVEARPGTSGVNFAGNPGFEAGMTSLSFIGNHSRSSLEANSGFPAGGTALHLRTGDGILTGPNAVQITLVNSTLAVGQTATLRFKARWLRGCPEPLLRFWGCFLEATARLPVPSNLGTPGLPNSQARLNAGPAIYDVTHTPAVPAANQAVVVTARVSDPDAVSSMTLRYRFDPSNTATNLTMNDAGISGDAIPGDGVYSATIPGRPTSAVAFVLQATDGSGATNRFPELVQDNAPARECVVFFGDPTPTNLFGTYHLWLSQSNVARWTALPKMSNEEIDGTFVYNNRVIYNMGGRYSGGPWHQNYDSPAGNRSCHYVWTMPKDDLLLGATAFNQIHWPGNDIQSDTITTMFDDSTLQREQAAYMFLRGLGVPWSYRRFVAVYVNGVRRGKLMEDAFRPTAGTAGDAYFPGDSRGQFYKIQRWYEGSTTMLLSECYLRQYTTTGGALKTARYRPNWGLKDTPGSLSDFTNVYTLITAANAYNQPNYADLLENVADMENWMRVSAANHAVGNWDCFGSTTGQNVDAWVSAQHRWTLFTIDLSICLDNRLSSVGLFSMKDPTWQQIIATPRFLRMYCRALNELVHGVMQASVINPVLDAKYNAFLAAGLTPTAPTSTKNWIANQRSSIISQLAALNATPFTLAGSSFTASSNSVTLTGTAPVEVVSITINGVKYTPTWTTVVDWTLAAPAATGITNWTVEARDRYGNLVAGPFVVSAENASVPDSPVGNIVFNEIMFNAPVPEAEYVELFNRSANTTFDLSGWRVNGLDYLFPPGSVLRPRDYLVLARSGVVFAATYGALVPVFDTFNGGLQADGETISLIKPGAALEPDVVVDRVRFETNAPWPGAMAANEPATSLQLIDAAQDNSRVANWTLVTNGLPGARATPGALNAVAAVLPPFPDVWLNEVQPENLTGPSDNFGEREPWVELFNAGTNPVSLAGCYLATNYGNLTQWEFPPDTTIAPGGFIVVWCDGQPEQADAAHLHTSFRLNTGAGTIGLSRFSGGVPQLLDYLNFPALTGSRTYGDVPDGQPFYRQEMFGATPGATNNAELSPISVRINEWMAENSGALWNPATSKYDDWFELYNPSHSAADLDGYYLTDALDDPFQFRIPAGYQVPAHGFLLVWADDKTSANGTNGSDLHVPFKLGKDGEAIGLFAPAGAVIDAVVFGTQTANISEGRYPDGGSLTLFMPASTPRAANLLPPAFGPPVLLGASLQGTDDFALVFETAPGHSYRIEYKEDLAAEIWLPLGSDRFATGSTLTIHDNAGAAQRYYRIVRLD